MNEFVGKLNDILWSTPVIAALIIVGTLFTIVTRFVQVRYLKEMIILMFRGKSSKVGVSSFQALSVALAGRVGTGNIAGVATAIFYGGPGAVFWMWLIAFIGASSAFVESTLAQIYKRKQDGQYRGGPAYYIEKGTKQKWFAVLFALTAILSTAFLLPGVQANAIADGMKNAFGIEQTWITGVAIVLLLGFIIFGGIKRIANVATVIVPFMALGYIVVAVIISIINIAELPDVIALIFRSAFGADAVFGGLLGSAIMWGVKRGLYSNEAGQGTGPHPAAAAEVSHPVKQGLVQAFSIYIDTLLVCSATAFMILCTGMYNTVDTDEVTPIVTNIANVEVGPGYTQAAVDSVFPGFGAGFVAIALFFFAFTTIMAYYYIAETNIAYLTKEKGSTIAMFILKVMLLSATMYGTINESAVAWALGDAGLGLMIWLNIVAIVWLAKPALVALKDYDAQKKQGLDPVFEPKKLGIENADFWENEYKRDEKDVS